jgi:hypothetical protein
MDDSKTDSAMPKSNFSMLADNGVLYRAPSQLSTVVARTYKIDYAQRSEYSVGAPIIFDLNTGTSYVDPQTAILSFQLAILNTGDQPATVLWGGGLGGCSLIDSIRIISKNGVEVDRTEDAGLLSKVLADYTLSTEGRQNAEMCDGYPTVAGVPQGFIIPDSEEQKYEISIPMKLLSGFFRPTVKGMLIPAGLASGLRIEMSLANPNRAFQSVTAGVEDGDFTYKILDAQMLLQLSDFNDPVQNSLFTQSAKTGLEYNFPAYFSTKVSNGQSQRINEQLKKAVSQANKCFAVVLGKIPYVSSEDPGTDYESIHHSGFNSLPAAKIAAFNWRLGSQFYPLEKLTRMPNYWAIANACFDELRNMEWRPNQVDYVGFDTGGKAIAAASLDMSDRINLSGSKINNSSVLELRMDLDNTNAVDVVLFLQFTAEIKVSGGRSVLKI